MGWMRHLGAFAGGASAGIRNGVSTKGEMQRQAFAQSAEQRAEDFYKKMSGMMDDFNNRRGRWAPDEPTPQAAPVATPAAPTASMNPEDAGPPTSIGGGDARSLMTRALPAAQDVAPPAVATPGIVPERPPQTARNARTLPFFQFLGS